METKKKNNKDVTKVICQNCGAEVIIPQHESTVIGTAIGQDSGLGTVVLDVVIHIKFALLFQIIDENLP